jgi:transcriptional regulator with XRE-family HTH domain
MSSRITAGQLRAARALLKLEQMEICARSGVSIATLRRMEGTEGHVRGGYDNVASVIAALEAAGVEFIPENGGGAGVRLKKAP